MGAAGAAEAGAAGAAEAGAAGAAEAGAAGAAGIKRIRIRHTGLMYDSHTYSIYAAFYHIHVDYIT